LPASPPLVVGPAPSGNARRRKRAAPPLPNAIKQREQELENRPAVQAGKAARRVQEKLKADIAAIGQGPQQASISS